MKLLSSFIAKAPRSVFVSMVLGTLAGLSYSLIIPLVLSAVDPDGGDLATSDGELGVFLSWPFFRDHQAFLFVFICLFILVARTASQVILTRIAMDLTTDLRTRMYRQIADAPIADLERIGHTTLLASITADVPAIIAGARQLPELLTNVVTLIGMLGFLFYLNSTVFWFVMGCIVFGIATYQVPMFVASRHLTRARRHLDGLHEAIRGLVYGAKELKLNCDKREDYFKRVLAAHETDVREASKTGHTVLHVALNYGNLLVFFVIGAVSFVFVNYHAIGQQVLYGVIMALLYVTGPIGLLLNFIPQLAMARVAMRRMSQLFSQIPRERVHWDGRALREWRTMRFESVSYQYPDRNEEAGFKLGPVSFALRRGEITFIVGGNGSGKSTLSKLITLHYQPTRGAIYFDEQRVDESNLAGFRRGVAAIYSDYHLFERALGVEARDVQKLVEDCLKALVLDRKVTFKEGRFSTLALSDGQRRRLALVAALVEDAELYLFDEWAADQDPAFKSVFYERILPELKAQGKAVVAVLHDDRYFHLADRLIVLNEGLVAKTDSGPEIQSCSSTPPKEPQCQPLSTPALSI